MVCGIHLLIRFFPALPITTVAYVLRWWLSNTKPTSALSLRVRLSVVLDAHCYRPDTV